jgi:hypothetical protein
MNGFLGRSSDAPSEVGTQKEKKPLASARGVSLFGYNTTLLNFNKFQKSFYVTYDISMPCSKILPDSSTGKQSLPAGRQG